MSAHKDNLFMYNIDFLYIYLREVIRFTNVNTRSGWLKITVQSHSGKER